MEVRYLIRCFQHFPQRGSIAVDRQTMFKGFGVPASLTVNGSSAISKSSFAAPSGSSLKAAIQRRLFSGVVGTRISTSPVWRR